MKNTYLNKKAHLDQENEPDPESAWARPLEVINFNLKNLLNPHFLPTSPPYIFKYQEFDFSYTL